MARGAPRGGSRRTFLFLSVKRTASLHKVTSYSSRRWLTPLTRHDRGIPSHTHSHRARPAWPLLFPARFLSLPPPLPPPAATHVRQRERVQLRGILRAGALHGGLLAGRREQDQDLEQRVSRWIHSFIFYYVLGEIHSFIPSNVLEGNLKKISR